MSVYYIFIAVLSSLCFLNLFKIKPKQKFIIYTIAAVSLCLFAGLRGYDPDYDIYFNMYHEIGTNTGIGSADIGFNTLVKFLTFFSSSPLLMFITVATLSVCLNLNSFRRYTPYAFVCLLLYFVHNYALKEMIQIRAGLAAAICMYSFRFLIKDESKKTILLWLIALTVHFSALIFILPIIAYRYQPTRTQILKFVLACLIIGTLYPLGAVLKNAVGVSDRLDEYIAYGDGGYASSLGIWTNANTIKCFLIFLMLCLFYSRIERHQVYFRPLIYSYTIGLGWLMCFNDFAIVGARMSNLLLSVEPVLLTYPLVIMKRSTQLIYVGCLIVMAIMIFQFNIAPDKIVPYQFVFK